MTQYSSIDQVLVSVNEAKGLPNEHYVSPETFAEEKQSVLFNNWSGIGFGNDIPNAGDARPIDFLGMPLLLIRDKDGSVGVFQNTCRHRGMILVEKPTNVRSTIRCPYHSWCYNLNGALRTTPHVGGPGVNSHEDINCDDLGLFRIRSYLWKDVVFVNISNDAPEFEEVHKDLLDRWKEFDQPMVHGGAVSSFKLEVQTNWKLAVENYCEAYHLPWIHPGLNSYSRLEDHYNIEVRGAYSGQGTYVYKQLKDDNGLTFPDFRNLGDQWNEGAEYIAVYPNVLMGIHRDHFYSILLEPVDLDRTIEHVEIYYPENCSDKPEYEKLLETNARQWQGIFEEDLFVVEGMQKGRKGDFFDGGKFSPAMDGPTHNFHHWVASQIKKGRQK
jgi:phenylpropionate dioxygenase-like ring-hydroxylating dioxygenase large terminal subunit